MTNPKVNINSWFYTIKKFLYIIHIFFFTNSLSAQWGAAQTLVNSGNVGASHMIIVNGNPAICYEEGDDLKYIRATNTSGTSWGSPVTIDGTSTVSDGLFMAIVDGNPAIAYFDNGSDDLMYVRASDNNGTSWGSPIIVASSGVIGSQQKCLVVVSGNPAISFYDHSNLNLKYVRASDATGSSWNTPISVEGSNFIGDQNSMTIVNGNPAIAYRDFINSNVKYIRATDATGANWGTPVIVDTSNPFNINIKIINNNPAISYGVDELMYVRASDINGSSWGSPITIDNNGPSVDGLSLNIISGKPAISYHAENSHDLKYAESSDVNGTSWTTQLVESLGYTGPFSSLVTANGSAAISYWADSNLKYIRSTVSTNCLSGSTTYNYQSQIDDFATNYPGCTNITGSLIINSFNGVEITNLDGLSQLESIAGNLIINNNWDLTDLSGLENITTVGTTNGKFELSNNYDLVDISDLGNLTSVGGLLQISDNTSLTSLSGLESLAAAGGLGIDDNILTSLSPLSNLTSLESISIKSPTLTDLTGLEGITSLSASLYVSSTDALTSLTGLENLTSIGTNLEFNTNKELNSISALSNLTSIGGFLNVRNNDKLTTLTGLEQVTSVGSYLSIQLNDLLADINGLDNLTSVNGTLFIGSNPVLTDLSKLSKLTNLNSNLLSIKSNTSLTSLNGLQNIDHTTISSLTIENNTSLATCEIESICDYFDNGGTGSVTNNATGCNTQTEVENACAALPIELINFRGNSEKNGINLIWQTNLEVSNFGFEIEHSNDGNDWHRIGFIKGIGYSTGMNTYEFFHPNPSNLNYYRLKQLDDDGQFEYSKTIFVDTRNLNSFFKVFPNPTNEASEISIEINTEWTEHAILTIYDQLGRIKNEIIMDELQDTFTISLQNFCPGIYLVELKTNVFQANRKLIVR